VLGFNNSVQTIDNYMGQPNIHQLLREGIAAAKSVQQKDSFQPKSLPLGPPSTADLQAAHARQLLLRVTELDETNIYAWLWLSAIVDSVEDKYTCLKNVLLLDPNNQLARAGLALLNNHIPDNQASTEFTPQYPSTQWSDTGLNSQGPSICPFCSLATDIEDTICPHCRLTLVVDCPACNSPVNVEWQHCANCDFEMGQYQFGAVYFTQLATAYKIHGQLSKAIDALNFAEIIMPNLPDLQRFRGEIQAELGQTEAAITTLKLAIELEPDQAGPYLMLGKVLEQKGYYQKVEQLYREAIKAVPQSSETYFAMGDLLMGQQRLREAWDYLQKTIHLDSDHSSAWIRVGQIYESQQKPSSAIRAYKRALSVLEPDDPDRQTVLERLKILQS